MRINLLLLLIFVFLFVDASAQKNNDLSKSIRGCYVYKNPCNRNVWIKYKFFSENYFIKKQKSVLSNFSYLGNWEIINDTIYLKSILADNLKLLPNKYINFQTNIIINDSIGLIHRNNICFSDWALYKKRTFFRSLISWIYFIYPQWEMKKDCRILEKRFGVKTDDCECGDMFF